MTRENFQRQMERLTQTYGDKAYPNERKILLWRAFEKDSDEVFTRAVDRLILTCRSTPLHDEFHEAISESRIIERSENDYLQLTGGTPVEILQELVPHTTPEAIEFAKHCVQVLTRKPSMIKQQWEEAVGIIEQTAELLSKNIGLKTRSKNTKCLITKQRA